VIPSDQQHELVEMLRDISFSYLMSIQSLEDKIFSHIHETEMAQVLRRSAHHDVEHEELHLGVHRDRSLFIEDQLSTDDFTLEISIKIVGSQTQTPSKNVILQHE
jgi:hypothetical protein